MFDDYIKLEFPAISSNESFARAVISSFTARLDPTLDELSDIKTAVSEAVTNSIVHAYPETIGKIVMRARITDDGCVEITIRDKGIGINDIDKAMEPLFTTGGEERSGMGFTIMQSFMDKVRVRSTVGKGTYIFMSKKIRRRQALK